MVEPPSAKKADHGERGAKVAMRSVAFDAFRAIGSQSRASPANTHPCFPFFPQMAQITQIGCATYCPSAADHLRHLWNDDQGAPPQVSHGEKILRDIPLMHLWIVMGAPFSGEKHPNHGRQARNRSSLRPMKKIVLLFAAFTTLNTTAQTSVTVTTGPGNAQQTWYTLATDAVSSAPLDEWDLAFEINGGFNAGACTKHLML